MKLAQVNKEFEAAMDKYYDDHVKQNPKQWHKRSGSFIGTDSERKIWLEGFKLIEDKFKK